ncbi:hypothetical protein ACE193_13050 [Bernardetia sp. OM2101]|uniref:hypothetical protein n=1 Tax=Bernardetia sp. OM2101 TaxID=3344876 RepID=UPI0035CF2C2C
MNSKKEKLEFIKFLPTAFLEILIILSILISLISNYTIDYKEYIGFILASVGTGLFFIRTISKKIYPIYTLVIITLGVCDVISFSIYHLVFTLNSLSFQIIPCISLFIYFYAFKEGIKNIRKNISRESELSKTEQQSKQKADYKTRFEKLSDEEIEKKLSQGLVQEAINALKEIQTERVQNK